MISREDRQPAEGVLAIIPYAYLDSTVLQPTLQRLRSRYTLELAYIQGAGNDIATALSRLEQRGCRRIVAVSLCQPLDRSLNRWLPGALATLAIQYPDLQLYWSSPEHANAQFNELIDALVQNTHCQYPMKDYAPRLGETDWEYPLQRRWHLLLCVGPRCKFKGATAVQRAIRHWLKAQGINENDADSGVQMTGCQCLFPCNQGPLLVINPGDTWYANLTPDEIPTLLERHLLNGEKAVEKLIQQAPSQPSDSAQ